MISQPIDNEMLELWSRLDGEGRRAVLDFAKGIEVSPADGVPGAELVRFAGTIDAEELERMSAAIEDGCEKVNLDEW